MLYTLITKYDIAKIKAILDSENIVYRVIINEELIEEQDKQMKYVLNLHGDIRRTDGFYNLILESDEFSKISEKNKIKLESLNIFPEMSENFVFPEMIDDTEAPPHEINFRPTGKKQKSIDERIPGILGLLILGFILFIWIDSYVIRIFPSDTESSIGDADRIFQGSLFIK
jgi:hypothetical protein